MASSSYVDHADGFEVLTINYREAPDAAMGFAQSVGMTLPIGMMTPSLRRQYKRLLTSK